MCCEGEIQIAFHFIHIYLTILIFETTVANIHIIYVNKMCWYLLSLSHAGICSTCSLEYTVYVWIGIFSGKPFVTYYWNWHSHVLLWNRILFKVWRYQNMKNSYKKKNIDHEEKSQRGFDKLEYRKKNTIFKSIKLNGQCYMQW